MPSPRIINHLRSSLWFVPVACVVLGSALSFVAIAIDRAGDYSLVPESLTGGPDAAIAILSTIAASMVSLAALVLTITMVVVQLAMGQFSPRIVQTFLRDKPSQFAVGLFVATFVHAMLSLREVAVGNGGTVPGVAILVSYALVVTSVVVLVLYVHHIGRSLRVSALIELVGADTRALLSLQYPDRLDVAPRSEVDNVIAATHSGVVTQIDREQLVLLAENADCVIEVVPPLGAFVPAETPLLRVVGDVRRLDVDRAIAAVALGLERTLEQDVAYGMRMLVDMAERSLAESPFLDPTTAVQALDRLHDCLRQLAQRALPDGLFRDRTGTVRVVQHVMDWDAFLHLAFDEIRLAGARSPQVTRRIVAALEDLETVVPPERLPAVRGQHAAVLEVVAAQAGEGDDIDFAVQPDQQGIGVTAGRADSRTAFRA
jgi:uncharacterized membrane protein